MRREMKLNMYRVYGMDNLGNVNDEYCEASTAQKAVDRVREWHSYKGENPDGYEVVEVSKVVRNWK